MLLLVFFWFFCFFGFFYYFIIPFGKFGSPYSSRKSSATQSYKYMQLMSLCVCFRKETARAALHTQSYKCMLGLFVFP